MTKTLKARLGRLLEMQYRPSEIAEELGISKDTVYRGWIPAGAPHVRDESGQLWLVGTELAAWLLDQDAVRAPVTLMPGEAYCMRCKAAVRIAGEVTREPAGYAVMVRGSCAVCGAGVARLVGREDGWGDSDIDL
jgi:hypothetical protein